MTNIDLIYSESFPAKVWVDVNQPLSLAVQTELLHRGWKLRQLDVCFQAFCSATWSITAFNEILAHLLNDEIMRKKIPPNTPVPLNTFVATSE